MIELHIYLEAKTEKDKMLEDIFKGKFLPAVSSMEGFISASMIKSESALYEYTIRLSFESEDLRLNWVASKEHQEVFPQIVNSCQTVSWNIFSVIGYK